jgi:uncharacterized lipoprotein YddW (UPF0748 family)
MYGQEVHADFTWSTWVSENGIFDQKTWEDKIALYQSLGITEILVHAKPESYESILPIADEAGIAVHAWMWTLNRPNDPIAMQHPDWYAVNRNGDNSLEFRAYVDYYQWLSPFHPDARAYIKSNVQRLLEIEGLASVHLDYVRYVDVILGADLQPKYNIVQDRDLPEYDYDYHPLAREGFKKIFGYDPLDLDHSELSTEWKQYRLNAITTLVNEIVDLAHQKNQKITAAVFPFPTMSRRMVGQAWNDWNLDAAYPMLYHNFYRESISWIGFATGQDVKDVDFPIHAGLFMAALENPDDLRNAILQAKENGASGISMFTADRLTDGQIEVLKELMKQ